MTALLRDNGNVLWLTGARWFRDSTNGCALHGERQEEPEKRETRAVGEMLKAFDAVHTCASQGQLRLTPAHLSHESRVERRV